MRTLTAILLIPAVLVAAHPDTLWIARNKTDHSVVMVFAPGWSVQYTERGRMEVTGSAVVRDSLGMVALLESRMRMRSDTSRVELLSTAADTLPYEWPGDYILTGDGLFEER